MNQPPPTQEDPEMTNISNAINTYTGGALPPPPEPPRTFVIECNKALAQQDGNANNPNEWTNTFPSVKLKKGDVVSVNSAFLNSRGAGDFLQFDDTNNKARVIFEYYGINDNTNNKRPAYNIKGTDSSHAIHNGTQFQMSMPPISAVRGLNMNCYPVNYRPMPLYRLMKTYDKYLSATTNEPNPAPGPNGIPTDGADLIPFTSTTSPLYQTTLMEPNWGYQNSPKEIVDNIEDNYVPGLYRHPLLNIRETVLADSSVTGGIFNNSGQARIWYISTQKSALSACSTDASMRIHFIGNHTGFTNQEYTDSLSFVKSLRPGQYVKFIHPEILFGFGSFSPTNYKAGQGVATYGSQCYVCTGYAADGNGHNGQVDRFSQNGKFTLDGGVGTSYASLFNPMGMFMKVVRTYFNANTGATQGQGSNTVNAGWLSSCPFIEVACAGSFSCAFGNPNKYTSLQGYGEGAPYAGTPGPYDPTTLTAASPMPMELAASPPKSTVMRTWVCTNNSTWVENVEFGENQTKSNIVHAHFFPEPNSHNEDWYVGYIPRTILGPDLLKAGCQMGTKENSIDGADGAWRNMSLSRDLFYQKTRGTAQDYPVITPINYNLLALNKDGFLSSADGDQTKLKYGKDYESTGLYAGGRLPEVWRPGNDIDEYDDGTNYYKITKTASFGYGQSFSLQAQENRTYRPGWAGNTYLNKSNRRGFLNAKGSNMESKFPVNNQQINQTNSLYIINQHLNTTKFWFAFDIDDQNVFLEPPYMNALSSGLAKASHPEWVKGTENFVVAVGDLVTPSTMEAGDKAKGDLCYGNWTSGAWTFVNVNQWNARDPVNPPTGAADPNIPAGQFPSATSDNFYVSGYNPGPDQGEPPLPTLIGQPDFTTKEIKDTQNGQTMVNGGLFDLRTVFANYGELGYARFTNTAGQTEIMYIYVIAHERRENPDLGYFDNTVPSDNNIDIDGSDMSYRKPATGPDAPFYPVHSGNPAQGDPVQDFIAPRFFILQRDCGNTGKVSFKGSWATEFGSKPSATDITAQLSYFEWLNDMADIEYQFKVDNSKRELLPLSSISAGAEFEYKRRFGLNPPVPVTDLGAGGDFIITKTLNQPYILNNKTFMTDNCLWLHDECLVQGDPTSFPKNDLSPTGKSIMAGHTGDLSWEIHYDYIDLQLDPDVYYYSVTDVANEITKQLHKPKDLYVSNEKGGNKTGGTFVGSAGKYPCNQLYRPIHGPSLTQEDVTTDDDTYGNNEDPSSGYLNGAYTEGDFIFFMNTQDNFFKNFFHANKWALGDNRAGFQGDQSVGDGIFPVWINNGQIRRNLAPTTSRFTRDDWTLIEAYEQLRILYNDDNYERADHTGIRNYGWDNVKCGQFIGTSSPSLNFNADNSRFEWQNFHQSLYSPTQKTGQGGGDIITNVWLQAIKGCDVWDRTGGINVVNWCAPIVEFGATNNRREVQSFNVLVDEDNVGSAFMTKLGFNDTFRSANSGSTTYPEDVGRKYPGYLPLGTTRSDYDISQAITYGVESQYHYAIINDDYDPTGGAQTNFRNTNFNGVAVKDLVVTSTAKWWGKGDTPSKLDAWAGEYLGNNMGATVGTPPDWQLDKLSGGTDMIEINPNDIKLPYMSLSAGSSTLTANVLPSKTDEGYFFIMSNIIDKHEFYGSANGGMPLNCIGILSKNYSNTDYFFSFQSPVEFYIKHDKILTSITTRILTPSMKTPGGLNINSSVIYSITRPQNIPEPDVPPIELQQMYDYALMDSIDNQIGMGGGMGGATGVGLGQGSGVGTAGGGASSTGDGGRRSRQTLGLQLNQLRQNLVQSALFPQPNAEVQAGMMMSEMGDTLSRMSIHARTQAILGEQVGDPTLNPMITPKGLTGIDAPPLVPLDTMPSMIQPSLLEEMAAHQIAGKKGDADQPATTSPIDYGPAAPSYRNVHFPDEDEDDKNLMNEWSAEPPAYRSKEGTPRLDEPKLPDDDGSISPSWMALSPRQKTAEKSFMNRFKNIGSTIMPQRRGQKGKKGKFDFELKTAEVPSGPMRPMPLQEWFGHFRGQQSDAFNRALNNQQRKGRNVIDDPTSWNMDFLKRMDLAVTNDNWNNSIGGQVNPRDIGLFSAELKARAQHKEQLGSKQTPRAPRPEYPTPLVSRAKGREAPYIGAPGKLSLYEAVARTTKHPTKVVRDDTHEASDWYLESKNNLNNKEKKKSNQSHGNENPFDIKTWSKPRLESYSSNPFFSIKKKHVKEANVMDKVTKGGMNLIDAEIKAREGGQKRILHTVSKKGADGTKVRSIGYKQGTAPPQYTTPQRAHEAPRGIGGASIRPPIIEQKAEQGIASGS